MCTHAAVEHGLESAEQVFQKVLQHAIMNGAPALVVNCGEIKSCDPLRSHRLSVHGGGHEELVSLSWWMKLATYAWFFTHVSGKYGELFSSSCNGLYLSVDISSEARKKYTPELADKIKEDIREAILRVTSNL